jgi:hypothetical protein
MNSHRNTNTEEENGALWRSLVLSEEDRLRLLPATTRPGGYRWLKSENVVCIEHFRPPARAGVEGWTLWLGEAFGTRYDHEAACDGGIMPVGYFCAFSP